MKRLSVFDFQLIYFILSDCSSFVLLFLSHVYEESHNHLSFTFQPAQSPQSPQSSQSSKSFKRHKVRKWIKILCCLIHETSIPWSPEFRLHQFTNVQRSVCINSPMSSDLFASIPQCPAIRLHQIHKYIKFVKFMNVMKLNRKLIANMSNLSQTYHKSTHQTNLDLWQK